MWNFFRLENEHLYNVGKFRAVRDISIGPIRRDEDNLRNMVRLMDSTNENNDNRDDNGNDDRLVETYDHDV